ncbi:hypothetical protein [Sporosalibacterium faouarense]|uniref:hypothetical protein n=1 Tax=Sporosalibacterium faouarense TaxID=516123 RepID=UPI00141CC9E8|nr:hypothetical protein [Sporosalibacterium faouarense]MTI47504.1 hypothetical protein [Bacillota bacterium]
MNNYTNMSGLSTDMNAKAMEINEAKRKMGTLNNYTPQSMGMTSSTTTTTNNATGYTNSLNNYTNLSSLNSVPNLNSSMSVGYSELQKAKQDMNRSSSTSFMS